MLEKASQSFLLLLFVFLHGLSTSPSWAGYPVMVPTLQPYEVLSPNGTWRLEIKPSDRQGAGPAFTSLVRVETGEVAWKQMLPFTFWQCCVNEEGVVAGYAYTKGAMGGGQADKDAGHLVVTVLDAKGIPMYEERTHRDASWVGMGYYIPAHCASRLSLDPFHDRMVILMTDGKFRCHSLRDGALASVFKPESKGEASGYVWPDEVRFFRNIDFMLLESNYATSSGDETSCISCLHLVDAGGRTVWAMSYKKTVEGDFDGAIPKLRILETTAESGPEPDPFAEDEESDPVPFVTEVAGFQIYRGDTKEKVTFQILDTSGNDEPAAYQVIEKAREKWTLPEESDLDADDAPPVDFPVMEAKQISAFQLKRKDGKIISEVAAIALGPQNKLHVLDREMGRIHVFDQAGKFLHTCDPGKEYTLETSSYSAAIAVDENGEVFAKTTRNDEVTNGGSAVLFLRFSVDGILQEKPLASPSPDLPGSIAVQRRSNHLIFFGGGNEVWVTKRDRYGSRAVSLTHRPDGHWLEYVQDVACAPNGLIAVRDTSPGDNFAGFSTPFLRLPNHRPAETINIYAKDGSPLRTIDFSRFGGLSEIDFDGKHLVATYAYDPSTPLVYVFDDKGEPMGAIRIAELAGKEAVNLRAFIVGAGEDLLAIDQESGMSFRFKMPQ